MVLFPEFICPLADLLFGRFGHDDAPLREARARSRVLEDVKNEPVQADAVDGLRIYENKRAKRWFLADKFVSGYSVVRQRGGGWAQSRAKPFSANPPEARRAPKGTC
jgi:hypothetical protein